VGQTSIYARIGLITRGHNTNNIVEAAMRILKDVVLQRCKAFNAVALVDFVCNVLEKYHTRRLIAFANPHNTRPEMQYRRFFVKSADLDVEQQSEGVYLVTSATEPGLKNEVNTDTELCDCPHGIGGPFASICVRCT